MPKIIKPITLAALGVVILTAVSRSRANVESMVGKPAPDITLKTYDGKDVRLSALKGKVVLIDFWASWCPPCVAALPRLSALANDKDLAAKGLVVWAVNAGDPPALIKKYLERPGISLIVPMDADQKAFDAYHIEGLPSRAIIGVDGTVKFAVEAFSLGEDTDQKIIDAIQRELAAK